MELICHMAYASSCIQNVEKHERVSTLHCLLLSDRVPRMVGSHQSETTSPIPPSLLQNHLLFDHGAYSKPTSLREHVHHVPLHSPRYRRTQRPVPRGPPNITLGYLTKKKPIQGHNETLRNKATKIPHRTPCYTAHVRVQETRLMP